MFNCYRGNKKLFKARRVKDEDKHLFKKVLRNNVMENAYDLNEGNNVDIVMMLHFEAYSDLWRHASQSIPLYKSISDEFLLRICVKEAILMDIRNTEKSFERAHLILDSEYSYNIHVNPLKLDSVCHMTYKPSKTLYKGIRDVIDYFVSKCDFIMLSYIYFYCCYMFPVSDLLSQGILKYRDKMTKMYPSNSNTSSICMLYAMFNAEINSSYSECTILREGLKYMDIETFRARIPIPIKYNRLYICNHRESKRIPFDCFDVDPDTYIEHITMGIMNGDYIRKNKLIVFGSALSGLISSSSTPTKDGDMYIMSTLESPMEIGVSSAKYLNNISQILSEGSLINKNATSWNMIIKGRKCFEFLSSASKCFYDALKNISSHDRIYYDGYKVKMLPSYVYYLTTGISLIIKEDNQYQCTLGSLNNARHAFLCIDKALPSIVGMGIKLNKVNSIRYLEDESIVNKISLKMYKPNIN